MSRFYIQLSNDEFVRLAQIAANETRSTREQAHHLIRISLGLERGKELSPNKHESAGTTLAGDGALVEVNPS